MEREVMNQTTDRAARGGGRRDVPEGSPSRERLSTVRQGHLFSVSPLTSFSVLFCRNLLASLGHTLACVHR